MKREEIIGNLLKIAKELIAGGKAVIRETVFFKSLTSIGKRSGRATYRDAGGYYYQWDSLHGEWQKYEKHGYHIGVCNQNGKMYKKPVKGRKINL